MTHWVRSTMSWLILLLAATCVRAQELEFEPVGLDDPALGAAMQELAAKALANDASSQLPLYDRVTLQLAAGEHAAAANAATKVREEALRAKRFPVRAVVVEVFARAKAMQAATPQPFEHSHEAAFMQTFAAIDDRLAHVSAHAMNRLPRWPRESFGNVLQRYPSPAQLSVAQAVELLRGYVDWQMAESTFPQIESLTAAEQRRRYVIEDGVLVNTPDGATVSAIIVRPRTGSRLPALLELSIYTYPWKTQDAIEVASHGYVGVVAFNRGKYRSSGEIVPYEKDGADARTMIDWISRQSWSDGRVGMYGGSYTGFAVWSVLKDPPRALKGVMTGAAAAPGIGEVTENGIYRTYQYPWVEYTTKGPLLDEEGYNDKERWSGLEKNWYRSGRPYQDLDAIDRVPSPIYRRWLQHPVYDQYWQSMTPQGGQFANIRIPVLQTTGYFDGAQIGTLHYFNEHRKHDRNAQHTLLIGPYAHLAAIHGSQDVVGGYSIDPAARIDLHELRYEWFDHVLKGAPRPARLKDTVNYQVMGANKWGSAPSLNAMSARHMRLHFVGQDSGGAYALVADAARDSFVRQEIDLADRSDADWLPAWDISSKSLDRHNAVVFMSEPLKEDTELSGAVRGSLDFLINKRDFDFTLRLYELTAGGEYLRLTIPYLQRASLARDRTRRQLFEPNVRQQLPYTLPGPMSRLVKSGGRVVVVLTINKQRDMEVNYGTGKPVTTESIADAGEQLRIQWFGGSFIDLPVGGNAR